MGDCQLLVSTLHVEQENCGAGVNFTHGARKQQRKHNSTQITHSTPSTPKTELQKEIRGRVKKLDGVGPVDNRPSTD